MDSLAQYENDAKLGRAEALYNLGLAYSTGQGVTLEHSSYAYVTHGEKN